MQHNRIFHITCPYPTPYNIDIDLEYLQDMFVKLIAH